MQRAESRLAPRLLLLLALIVLIRHLSWSIESPVAPTADRYGYLARAQHLLEGEGPRAQVEYPLRFAFEGAESLPAVDVVRPPLWPALMALPMSVGAGDAAGTWLGFLAALILGALLYRLGTTRFGALAGAGAALAFVCSFATRRAMWGGGPEMALALLLLVLWAWAPVRAGSGGAHLASASLYGALPALHPTGWLFAIGAAFARPARYGLRWLAWMLLVAVAIGVPWYARNHFVLDVRGGSLQAQAELAKSLWDAGGLGPYLGLEPVANSSVLREAPGQLLHLWLHRWKELLLHLDGWMAWPLVLAALWGARRDPRLALRDAALGFALCSILLLYSDESRLLLPLLPIAAIWAGAGLDDLARRGLPWPALGLIAILPWLLPMGLALRPGVELRRIPRQQLEPPLPLLAALAAAAAPEQPILCDSSVLAFRSGRPTVFVPRDPQTWQRLRERPALAGLELLALGGGGESRWIADPAWRPWIAAADTLHAGDGLLLRLPRRLPPPEPDPPGPGNELAADYAPVDLIELPVPPATREGIQLRRICWQKLERLLRAADDAGVPLRVISGYRSHARQAELYASAQARHGADQGWVAAPGQSEHQLGDTVDLADLALEHVLEASFGDTPEGIWLRENSRKFGFRITYTAENEARTGIRAEPWHIRCLEEH